jgi:serine/threonine protein phosphatase PrpC
MDTMVLSVEKSLQIDSAAFSDRGKKRKLNEDTIFLQTGRTPTNKNVGLFLVCDGIGGHHGGEIASRIAVDTITTELADLFASADASSNNNDPSASLSLLRQKIHAAVTKANSEIRQYAQNQANQASDLGTTVTLVAIYDNIAYILNAGDGRVYGWRAGRLSQITQDHSLAAALAKEGLIDETEVVHHPQNHIIFRALGIDEVIEVDAFNWTLQEGDKLLLCSDGLWKAFENSSELGQRLAENLMATDLCRQLVNEANRRDGSDNISAIVVTISEATEC